MNLAIWIPILLFAVTIHEVAHGFVAFKLGDSTAKNAGRLTLNPINHIDPFGTILMPLLLYFSTGGSIVFGYAKPVPVNFYNLNNPKRDMIWVGAAGPLSNIFLSMILAFLLKSFLGAHFLLAEIFRTGIVINLLLASFNILPIPPLDGSRVVSGLLPQKQAAAYAKLEPYGFLILIVLFYFNLINLFVMPIFYFLCKMLGLR
ncbi:site-2 protease family protein [Candidatus Auribacterota bacterium]